MSGLGAAYVLWAALIFERGIELLIARRNERWIRSQGGVEAGAALSKAIVLFHVLWFFGFLIEATFQGGRPIVPAIWVGIAFGLLQAGRYWCIFSLGKFWNTKLLVLPGAQRVQRGPYRWVRHPNYAIVLIEIFLYPALLGCWWTAAGGSLTNVLLLQKRIAQEDRALGEGAQEGAGSKSRK